MDNPVFENDLPPAAATRSNSQRAMGGGPLLLTQMAGWWAWCMSCWVGGRQCEVCGPWSVIGGRLVKVGDAGGIPHDRLTYVGMVAELISSVGDASGINASAPC